MNRFASRSPFLLWPIVLLLVALVGCERRAGSSSVDTPDLSSAPKQESWNVHLSIDEGSRPRLEMIADYMAEYEQEDSTYLLMRGLDDDPEGRVTVHLYDEAGDSSATVTADRIRYYEEARRFEARGNVVVVTPADRHLYSEHLSWDEETRKVQTPGFVRIITPQEKIQGYRLVADEDLSNYSLANVTGQVYREE